MKILPYDKFTIVTPDSLSVVLQRLSAEVEASKVFRFSREHAPYQGTVSEQSFHIRRIIDYRNSFLPVIRGSFEAQPHQTVVQIQMSVHPFVMAFLGCWLLFWYGANIPLTFAGDIPSNIAVFFLGMPIVLLIAFWAGFWTEANHSRTELAQIIQGSL
ncbi:MAG: hypothetical protein KME23_25420 [Goleter apudmare HA4340-LM2]|jgi:hypothetical protein|nr:hypothetical protein [Goleter apudmare HA4340-LM2]